MNILIVEDDPNLRSLYAGALRPKHNTLAFCNATEAFGHYVNHSKAYDLVIVDYKLPLRCGKSLIFDIKSVNPDQRVVMISGNVEILSMPEKFKVLQFSKPMSKRDLNMIVEACGTSVPLDIWASK